MMADEVSGSSKVATAEQTPSAGAVLDLPAASTPLRLVRAFIPLDAQDPAPEEDAPVAEAPKKEEPVETPPPAGFEWGKTA